jgi:RNA polymerase sigma-70 factor (ECF subfamily)
MARGLVERAQKGDHDAFAVLARGAISRLDKTAWLMLRDADQASDAVQNALVRAWRDLPSLRDPDRFEAWLYRLVIRACADELRRARSRRFDVDITDLTTAPVVSDSTTAVANRDQLERGFRQLGPEERSVIVLHHYLDLPLPEVASTLQLPLGTVKSRLYRGLRQMRATLEADARAGREVAEGHPA